MLSWEVGSTGLRATDTENAELVVRGQDLSVEGPGPDIDRPVDETVVVTARSLQFPHEVVYAYSLADETRHELTAGRASMQLPPGEYIIDVDADIKTYLRFSGPATIERSGSYDSIVCRFPETRRAVIGFRSRHNSPTGTITVPDSPEAVATAITHAGSSHKTDGPDRSYPTLRGHPPLFECGDRLDIPPSIRNQTPDTGVELVVPRQYEPLFVVAPLAYYLQATVSVIDSEEATPRLRLPNQAIEQSLSRMPTLEYDVEQLLRKIFFLDCLVRNAGPYGTTLAEESLLEALELDAPSLYAAAPDQRLASYLQIPNEAIDHRLPEWHLSTYVDAGYEKLEALPFLLDRLSLIYRPRTSELEGRELIERSLDDFYRNTVEVRKRGAGEVPSVDTVKPDLRHGRAHGWLADGVPIDVFKASCTAYKNSLEYRSGESDSISIQVVLNDPEMKGEQTTVAEIYQQRSEELPIDLSVDSALTTADLARVFETDHDFVHYIGHCETDGLRCADGYLSATSLEQCRTQTFFLNACGSFYEGMELIERGSVAGAVTFTKVLNEQAVTVGSTFAKLLVHGFSIERALRLARRRIMMGKDYAVVGDGTHSLIRGHHQAPTTIRIEPIEELSTTDDYLVSFDCYSTRMTGPYYVPHTQDNDLAYLCGHPSYFIMSGQELPPLLRETNASVIYDGDVAWSKQLADELASKFHDTCTR